MGFLRKMRRNRLAGRQPTAEDQMNFALHTLDCYNAKCGDEITRIRQKESDVDGKRVHIYIVREGPTGAIDKLEKFTETITDFTHAHLMSHEFED